jgi:uncharacterized protein YhaN
MSLRLLRIHADRFGALDEGSLGPFGPHLSIVHGPNESGKTTFTDLVRHILFGFPDRRMSERLYEPPDGDVRGRLVFGDDQGTWSIERRGRRKGGVVSIEPLEGPDRPALLQEVTAGVGRDAFRIVFGFGLGEMAAIEEADSSDELVGRLYAASAGLEVSPQDALKAVSERAERLFAPGARTREINELAKEQEELTKIVGEAEQRARKYAEERKTLARLDEDLVRRREARGESLARANALQKAAEQLEETERQMQQVEVQATESRREDIRLRDAFESIDVDEAAVEAEPVVRMLLADSSKFEAVLDELGERRTDLQLVEQDIAALESELLAQPGSSEGTDAETLWPGELDDLLALPTQPETRAELERRAAPLENCELLFRQAREAAVAEAPATSAGGGSRWLVAASMVALGAVAVALGLALDQLVAVGVGVALAVLAAVAWFAMARPSFGGEESGPTPREREAERALSAALDEWTQWSASVGLPISVRPAAARRLMGAAERAKDLAERRRRAEAAVQRLEREADDYVARVVEAARGVLDIAGAPAMRDVKTTVARLEARVSAACEDAARRDDLAEKRQAVLADLAALEAREAELRDQALAILEEHFGDGGSLAELQREAQEAADAADVAQQEYERVLGQRSELDGALKQAQGDREAAEARLKIRGLDDRIAEATGQYAIASLARRLLEQAIETYERERQPDVVRRAQEAFARMTGERYVRVTAPLDASGLRVLGDDDSSKSTGELSRGTAEQLYLALRLGLLEHMTGVGPGLPVLMDDVLVNFDPERQQGAAQAIAALAETRQVILFTCHPATVDVFKTVSEPDVLELDRC